MGFLCCGSNATQSKNILGPITKLDADNATNLGKVLDQTKTETYDGCKLNNKTTSADIDSQQSKRVSALYQEESIESFDFDGSKLIDNNSASYVSEEDGDRRPCKRLMSINAKLKQDRQEAALEEEKLAKENSMHNKFNIISEKLESPHLDNELPPPSSCCSNDQVTNSSSVDYSATHLKPAEDCVKTTVVTNPCTSGSTSVNTVNTDDNKRKNNAGRITVKCTRYRRSTSTISSDEDTAAYNSLADTSVISKSKVSDMRSIFEKK